MLDLTVVLGLNFLFNFSLHLSRSCSNHSWVSFQGFSAAYNDYASNIGTCTNAEKGICSAISINSRSVLTKLRIGG